MDGALMAETVADQVKVWCPYPDGEVPEGWPTEYVSVTDYERVLAKLKKFDPDPVVCGCHEALCPHTPIAKLPRQALVDHYKERISNLTDERDRAIEAVAREGRHARKVEINRLREALESAVEVIETWHGMHGAAGVWDIYYQKAPEMKLIREVLENTP